MKQGTMNNLHEYPGNTRVYDRTRRGGNGNGNGLNLSEDSLQKYADLIKDLNNRHDGPVSLVVESLHLDNTQNMLRRSEEKVRRIFNNSFDGIAVLDLNGIVMEANLKILEICALGTESEMIGKSYLEFISPRDRKLIKTKVGKLLAGERVTSLECCIVRDDGTELAIEINATMLNDVFNRPSGFLLSIKDVTRRKRAEEANKLSTEKMFRVVGEIIEAMARMVEIRDPYTAGHQRRVSELAAAIAIEMGLSAEKVESVRVAGMVHDIGKIYIPAEILSKPAELNEMEYKMIQQHPQLSYHILGNIEFPWPVATIVFQHHERCDGSGYPEGLSGDDILIEARILAVADVVEAMASHRPYREALGIEKALDEISRQSGILYDARAVEACVKLLNDEKAFNFN